MKRFIVRARAMVDVEIEVEANSRVEAMAQAEGMRSTLVDAVFNNQGTIVNLEVTGAHPAK